MGTDSAPWLERLVFRGVDRHSWGDLERLFESRGGPGYCWCMAWRSMPSADRSDREAKKAALRGRVAEGVPVGLLGYVDGEPVAWCSIAPRDTYRSLGGVSQATTGCALISAPADGPDRVWSLVCFVVPRRLRGHGITKRAIEAALDHAGRHGATVVEAYPVEPDSPSYRFMGFISSFAAAGFTEVGRAGSRRHVMQRRVQP